MSVQKDQYAPTTEAGQVVFADTVQSLTLRAQKSLTTIAHVTATGAGSLVKSGTTSDVYSVNAAGQAAAAALGGGGSLNQAYSAIATVPGAYVVPNQTGWFQTVHIRGGDFDQVGYEFDGVPVNRSFDNYPSGAASSLGNSEVQVYTGATPADSQGEGLAGYINQVIRTGAYPGFADAQLGIGSPTFYHRAAAEIGGATPDRLFSYYLGVAGYNQAQQYVDNQNAANYQGWLGVPIQPMGNPAYAGGGWYLAPIWWNTMLGSIAARDVVANVHFGIQHQHDGGRDDVQVLWDSDSLHNLFYGSTSSISSNVGCGTATTGAQCATAIGYGVPKYTDGLQYNCGGVGSTFTSGALTALGPKCVSNYYFPDSTNRTAPGQPIPNTADDTVWNDQEIVKIQYTHNMGSSAFLRVYGYTYYSDWLNNAPQSADAYVAGCCPPDYELSSHTRGIAAQFQDQFNAQNLVSLQASYITANSIRDNNTQWANTGAGSGQSYAAVLVNAGEPYAGVCYNTGGGLAQSCKPGGVNSWVTWSNLQAGTVGSNAGTCALPGSSSQACTYLLAESGLYGTYNAVKPAFYNYALTDQFRPSDKWLINLGVRLDNFTFNGSNTDNGPARQFWFNAYNNANCVNHVTGAPYPVAIGAPCATGDTHAYLQNTSAQVFSYNIWQPRLSGTYTMSPDTVLRFSYGRYVQAPNTAFEQYNTLENDLPFALLGPNFLEFGRNTPGYPIVPPTSLNYDVSLEHHVHGTDWSFKLTPFLRQTQDQIQNFFLNQQTAFISGLNVGGQRSQGFELQAQKGDFSKNGLSGLLSFTYTNSYIHYGPINQYGATVVTPINVTISQYNAYTKACAPGGSLYGKTEFGLAACGSTTSGVAASPCYSTATGAPVAAAAACPAGSVTNPYWASPAQNLIDPTQAFPTYSIFPAGIGSSADAYGAPYVATLLLNYKRDRLTITPSFTFVGGGRYGAPETSPGVDPAAASAGVGACSTLPGTTRYNAAACPASLVIPDPYTGVYDGLGSFVQPNLYQMNLQVSYEVSPRVTLTGTFANILNGCSGGSKEPWTVNDGNICSYGSTGLGLIPPVGNAYNPPGTPTASIIQPFQKYPYLASLGAYNDNGNATKTPFQFFLSARIKL